MPEPDRRAIIREYTVESRSLAIDRPMIERGLGYPTGRAPTQVTGLIDEVMDHALDRCSLRCGFVTLPPGSVSIAPDSITCVGIPFCTGPIIARPLRKSATVVLFVATAGAALEAWSRELMHAGDLVRGYIVDSFGSDIVELAADWLERQVQAFAAENGWKASNRYSPGYCGWPVKDQQGLFSLLPDGFCGITLTESSLMKPIKSVSGIIGVGQDVKRSEYQCKICDMEDCYRRREEFLLQKAPRA